MSQMNKVASLKTLQPANASHQKVEDPFQKEEASKLTRIGEDGSRFNSRHKYKPYPTRFPLHFGRYILIHSRIRCASGLHGNFMSQMNKNAPLKNLQPPNATHQRIEDPVQKARDQQVDPDLRNREQL